MKLPNKYPKHVFLYTRKILLTNSMIMTIGSHTMGKARCLSFRQRVYDANYAREHHDKYKRYTTFRRILRSICPESGDDQNTAPLDLVTPIRFDNNYFLNVLQGKALLGSDNVLLTQDFDGAITNKVWAYAYNEELFFASFAHSMIKMGNINVLTGEKGEIRTNCRFVNTL